MIKFFRKIRQKLLSENKFSKYLFYAIGEIALVVIGILIALQINNWNEEKQERKKEKVLLSQLQSDFTSNLEQLDDKIEMRNNMILASLKLLEYVNHPEKRNIDSIYTKIGFTIVAPTFDPIVNDILSSGRVQLLRNNELKGKLSSWTSEVVQVTEEEAKWAQYENRHYSTLLEYGSMRNILDKFWKNNVTESYLLDKGKKSKFDVGNSNKEIDLNHLLDHSNFEDHIAFCATLAKIANSQSDILRSRIIEILDLIELELKK
ncbi:DUF6090 family protein [Robiginitalea sp. IMCC43444]|uniref:DUF6090 family protein n=1 Tax=Robiginitalea sp. IMCC43444 TaxID=3459121 RepID=UPI0040413D11